MKDMSTLVLTIIGLLGGLGLFLYGMNIMADGLQKSAGSKMKKLLSILTTNRFLGVAVGALVTAIIQSSSATTVMVVGFVNAGLINLLQATGVIMGANIGTTITSWIVSLGEWASFLKPSTLAPLAAGIGAMMFVFGNDRKKQAGEIIIGFGLLFMGLELMSNTMKPFQGSQIFRDAFQTMGANPILGILVGLIVTAVIQSSSASVGILQSVASLGLVPWNAAVYIILGQNIGTCVTAILSAAGANRTAKRAALIHLLFNITGTILFAVGSVFFFRFNAEFGATPVTLTGISIFHTIFNVANTVVLFPFSKQLVHLAEKLLPEHKTADGEQIAEEKLLKRLDERILNNPGFAIATTVEEVLKMADLTASNLRLCQQALTERDDALVQRVFEQEDIVDRSEKEITEYLIKINEESISERQSHTVTALLHTVNDIERISDHSENMAELIQNYIRQDLHFSEVASDEIRKMMEMARDNFEEAVNVRRQYDFRKAEYVKRQEDAVDAMEEDLRFEHINRLAQNACDTRAGVVFLDVISNLERVSDHCVNIVEAAESEL